MNAWIKATDKILFVHFNEDLIKQNIIADKKRHTDLNDFSENIRLVLDDDIHNILNEKAARVGRIFGKLIHNTLKVHVFLNL